MDKALAFTGIVDAQVWIVWHQVGPLIKPALADGETIQQVLADIQSRKAQLWIAATDNEIHAACVTELSLRGERLYCNVWLAGGRGVNNWIDFLDEIEVWAKAQGCHAMTVDRARPGWKRLLKGYKTKTITLTKEL